MKGNMSYGLYEYELKENIDYWEEEMRRDKDEFVFVVTENNGDVAMLLITKTGELFINEKARDQLQLFWYLKGVYKKNIELLLPSMAKQLKNGELSVNGVNTLNNIVVNHNRI